MKKRTEARRPSPVSLREVPEVDFRRYGRGRANPFAKRMREEGWQLVHDGPSAASLRDMPELPPDVTGRRNPYAKRIKAGGIELQVGRGRPRAGRRVGPTVVKSVRLPPALWKRLEQQAREKGVALHALVRSALVDWLDRSRLA